MQIDRAVSSQIHNPRNDEYDKSLGLKVGGREISIPAEVKAKGMEAMAQYATAKIIDHFKSGGTDPVSITVTGRAPNSKADYSYNITFVKSGENLKVTEQELEADDQGNISAKGVSESEIPLTQTEPKIPQGPYILKNAMRARDGGSTYITLQAKDGTEIKFSYSFKTQTAKVVLMKDGETKSLDVPVDHDNRNSLFNGFMNIYTLKNPDRAGEYNFYKPGDTLPFKDIKDIARA